MKKFIVMLLVAMMAMLLVPSVGAQGGLNYDSGFQVQNLDDANAATVMITFYNKDGSVDTTVTDTVAAGSNKTFFPLSASVNFDGSAVISSDRPVAAIVNVLANNFSYGASYGSFDAGANEVNLPLMMKANAGFNTWFNVQNAGSNATTVTVDYANSSCTESATIQPGAAATFDQQTNSCLPSGYVGAATLTASDSGSIVATAMEVGATTLFAYNGFTTASTNLAIPLVNANNAGFITGIQIQNTGNASTAVTLSYSPVVGTACTETKTIPANSSRTFALYAFTFPNDPNPGTNNCDRQDPTDNDSERFVGAANVTSNSGNQPLVAIVNQLGSVQGSAYNAFDPSLAGNEVVMPLIMDRNSGFYTGLNVMNVGTATTVTCTYSNASGSVTRSFTTPNLATGGVENHLQLNFLADGFVGSGSCVANSAGGAILAVVNELGASTTSDQLFTYEAFQK